MNTSIANLKLADTNSPDVPDMPDGVEPIININSKAPALFAVDRGQGLEPIFGAATLEDARQTIKKQVVSSKTSIVYIYTLIGAEAYQPTSVSLDIDEVMAQLEG